MTADEALDQAWKAELLTRATDRLQELYAGEGKKVVFDVFQDYFLADAELDYTQVAEKYGITNSTVSNHLARAKKRLYEVLKELVSETVLGTEELEDEMAQLFGNESK